MCILKHDIQQNTINMCIMKNVLQLIIALVITMFVTACNSSQKEITIVNFEREQKGESYTDNVKFSDGSYLVMVQEWGPSNSLAEFFDTEGKRIATWASASECYTQYIVYNYDKSGKLLNMRKLFFDNFADAHRKKNGELSWDDESVNEKYYAMERELENEYFGKYDDEEYQNADSLSYITFRRKIDQIDYSVVDTMWCQQVNFEYNHDGELLKITTIANADVDQDFQSVIEANDNYKLNYQIIPSASFWESDINGGCLFLQVDKVRVGTEESAEPVAIRYFDGIKAFEKYLNDNTGSEYKVYSEYTDDERGRDVTTIRYSTNDADNTIVTVLRSSSPNTEISIWQNGKMVERKVVSAYGTEIEKITYAYLSTGVNVRYNEYDYKTKRLRFVRNEFLNKPDYGQVWETGATLSAITQYWWNHNLD